MGDKSHPFLPTLCHKALRNGWCMNAWKSTSFTWKLQTCSFRDRASNTVRDAIWSYVGRVNHSSRSRVALLPRLSFLHWEPPAWMCSSLGASQAFWAPVFFLPPGQTGPPQPLCLLASAHLSSSSALPVPTPLTNTSPNLLLSEGLSLSSMQNNTVLVLLLIYLCSTAKPCSHTMKSLLQIKGYQGSIVCPHVMSWTPKLQFRVFNPNSQVHP